MSGIAVLQAPGRLDAVHHRHPHVHQHDVGLGCGDELQRLGAVARLADDHELVGVQQRDQGVAEARVVVHDQDRTGATSLAGRRIRGKSLAPTAQVC